MRILSPYEAPTARLWIGRRTGLIHSHLIGRHHQRPSPLTLIVVGMLEDHQARISALEAAQGITAPC
ncbi:hypothetical protein MELE44368_02675 [Mycolicibacterium elephantis DSM 44368]|uniref:Uncharacterized protein n=1 Tax=Mycolicibacterium elephantis DSM 44368 TaxID=1335622 RepID=A0A439DV06_9MYCO|nr:hypothetical protein MELE44368_02675 [Mycolicibacterium elephantis DSM 44368]